MPWSGEATFFLLAAAVQAALGIAIVLRRPRVEWALVLGAIFLGNAAIAVNSLLRALAWGPWIGETTFRVFYVFDRFTTLLVLYLALAYPTRPRWARHPAVLPILFFAALAAMLFPFALRTGTDWNEGLYDPLRDVLTFKVASAGFLVLLVRWAYLLPRTESPSVLTHFCLLFAAFALRGVHVELLFFGGGAIIPNLRGFSFGDADEAILILRGTASLLAVGAAAWLLVRARGRVPSERRRAIDIVLAFMLLGFIEFFIEGGQNLFTVERGFERYVTTAFFHLDVSVVRPILVLYAMVRYDFLGSWARNRRSLLAVTGALAAIGFASAVQPGLAQAIGDPVVTWAITIPVAIILAVVGTLLVNANIGTPPADAPRRYLALLEDLYRNEEPSPARLSGLERERRRLGLDEREAEALRAAVASRWTGDATWLPGQRIAGRYELQRLLAAGGWGEVYLAEDVVDARRVVLKRTKALSPLQRKALLAEVYALTRLSHPHLVPLLRSEVVAGEPLLVLEHMPGGTLASRLAEGRLPRREAHRVAHGLLWALSAVHQAGIVHGDVKPGNLLYDADARVRLGDFGLARPSPAPAVALGDPTPTPLGQGSVRYLAPEQARGGEASFASDVYAAGLVVLECLTGEHPIPQGLPDYEQRRRSAEDPVQVPDLGAWTPLLQAMLDGDPARRPTAAQALARLPSPRGTEAASGPPRARRPTRGGVTGHGEAASS